MRRALPLALLLTGCVQLTDTNPVGTAASIAGAWMIDGQEPTRVLCERLGASRMQVTFLDGLRPVAHPGLFFQCDVTRPVSGETGFDTRDASGFVVDAGCWTIRTDALDVGGTVIAIGPSEPVFVPGEDVTADGCGGTDMGDHIALPTTDFLTGEVRVWTTIDGTRAGEASCADRGIAEVTLVVDTVPAGGRVDGLGVEGQMRITQPCSLGLLAARVLTGDGLTYQMHLETSDDTGAMIDASEMTPVVPAGSGDLCYFDDAGATCRPVCADGCDCVDSHCRPSGAPDVPTVDIGSL